MNAIEAMISRRRRLAYTLVGFVTVSLGLMITLACSKDKSTAKELTITYVANEGYLLKSGNKKVLTDAIFKDGYGLFDVPNSTVRDLMITGQAPFENVNLYLLTHHHQDHCDPAMLKTYLTKQPKVPFVCSAPSLQYIKSEVDLSFAGNRVHECNPGMNQYMDKSIQDIPFKVLSLQHMSYIVNGVDMNAGMSNNSYLLDMNGIRVFHSGDIMRNALEGYLQEKKNWPFPIDVAFLYFQLIETDEDLDFVVKHLNPRYIVMMHTPASYLDAAFIAKLDRFRKKFPNLLLFTTPLESKTIQL